MSAKSDDEVERSPKRQKTSGDEAEAEDAEPVEKKDKAGDDGEAKPANAADGKTGEGRKRPRNDVKESAEELVNKLLTRPIAKKADVRGRRLLGGLMSHLLSAKSRLKEEGLLDPSKRRATEAKADRAAQEKETQYLEKRLERHYTAMKNFIRTRAEPTVFYLPKKHTSKTQGRLDETKDAVEQKIKALKVHLRATSYDPLEEPKKEPKKEEEKTEAKNGKSDEKKEEKKKDAQSGSESEVEEKKEAPAETSKKADDEEKRKSKSKSRSPSAASN